MLKYEKDKEKQAFKEMTFKLKLAHIWEYYRLPIGICIVCAFFLGWCLNHYIINPPKNVSVNITIHTYVVDQDAVEEVEEELAAEESLSDLYTDTTEIELLTVMMGLDDTTSSYSEDAYAAAMKMLTLMASNSIDLIVGDETALESDAYNGYLMSLYDVFTDEELELIEEMGYVQEDAESSIIWSQQAEMDDDLNEYLLDAEPYYIDISGNLSLRTSIAGEATYIGFCSTSPNLEEAKDVFWYLLEVNYQAILEQDEEAETDTSEETEETEEETEDEVEEETEDSDTDDADS